MGEQVRHENRPSELEIDDIDRSSKIVIEESVSMTFTERDYITFVPTGLVTEIFVTISCRVKGKSMKVRMDAPHFLLIYKKAKGRGISIKKGKDYKHTESDESGNQKEATDFDILEFLEKCIASERDGVGDMFL